MIRYLSASDTSMKWWLRHCFFFRNKTSQQHVIWRVQQHTFSQKSNCLSVTDAILNTITFHLNIKICIKRKEVHCSVWQLFHYFSVHINAPQTSSHTHTHTQRAESSVSVWCFSHWISDQTKVSVWAHTVSAGFAAVHAMLFKTHSFCLRRKRDTFS